MRGCSRGPGPDARYQRPHDLVVDANGLGKLRDAHSGELGPSCITSRSFGVWRRKVFREREGYFARGVDGEELSEWLWVGETAVSISVMFTRGVGGPVGKTGAGADGVVLSMLPRQMGERGPTPKPVTSTNSSSSSTLSPESIAGSFLAPPGTARVGVALQVIGPREGGARIPRTGRAARTATDRT